MELREILDRLRLEPLPDEGGYYRETYRSSDSSDGRALATAIYYLLSTDTFSAVHRLDADEVYHFYRGDPVELWLFHADGNAERRLLGTDIAKGHVPQSVVSKGTWQGSRLVAGGEYALLGTTVAPAFEFRGFELGRRDELLRLFPSHTDTLASLTRDASG